MAQGSDGPQVTHMATPPRDPDLGKTPGFGCSGDDILRFVLKKFQDTEKDITDLEGRIAGRLNVMERSVAKFEALDSDLSVYTTIKNFVTQSDLDAAVTKFENDVKTLAGRSQELIKNLDDHFVKLDGLEMEFKGHLNDNFMLVEREVNHMKVIIQGVHDQAGQNAGTTAMALQVQVNKLNEDFLHAKGAAEAQTVGGQQ